MALDASIDPAVMTPYRFGRRVVASDWPFQALPLGKGPDHGDVILQSLPPTGQAPALDDARLLQQWGEDGSGPGMALYATADGYLLRFPGQADFDLGFDQRRIRMLPLETTDRHALEHLLVDQVLPRFCAHQGELLVHASAVNIGGRTALFLGESGWGKSTLAGLLQRAGHVLLSDDCVQMAQEGGVWRAWPTYPSLRLFDDSIGHACPRSEGLTAVAGYTRKRRVPVRMPGDDAIAPVAALYLLDEPSEHFHEVSIAPMRPVSACLELMRHAFKLDMADRARTQGLFAACSDLARAVPAFSLDYPRDFARSDELVRSIARHLASPGNEQEQS